MGLYLGVWILLSLAGIPIPDPPKAENCRLASRRYKIAAQLWESKRKAYPTPSTC